MRTARDLFNETYFKFNDALIKGSSSNDIIALEGFLNNTLNKLPSSPGIYYRGIGKDELDKILRLGENGVIKYDNFLSSSIVETKAARFVKTNRAKTGVGAWVEVKSKNGKSIAKYSDAEFEAEVLHKSKTSFKIKSIEFKETIVIDFGNFVEEGKIEYHSVINNAYKIVLEEI